MDTGKRQHLQDIYATDHVAKDDYTPQVSSEAMEERNRDIRRHQFTSFVLGMTILVLLIALVYVIAREYLGTYSITSAPTPITHGYIPRYSLAAESQWVLDLSRNYGNPTWNGEGKRPFSAEWIRKAAYNLVLAEQAAGLGKNEQAAEYYENALEILPNMEGAKVPLGMIYFKLEAFDKALVLLEDAPEADLTPDILNNLGAACINAKAYDRAETYLEQAIAASPTYAEPQKNMAVLYKEQKRDAEAVAAYEKYIDLNPQDINTLHSFALYLTKIGKWEDAANLLHQLTQEMPDDTVLFQLLAQVEIKNGQPEKAIKALQRFNQLSDPNAALGYMSSKEFDQVRNSADFQAMVKALESSQK